MVAWLVCAAPAGAQGPCDAAKHLRPDKAGAPLAIGDSVMLGAVDELRRAGIEVDARGCRQASDGVALLRRRRRLPLVVILHLGTNGAIRMSDVARTLRVLGRGRLLVLMTSTGPNGPRSSAVMRSAAQRWPRRTRLVDWARIAGGRIGGDGIHLGPSQARLMARLLRPFTRVHLRARVLTAAPGPGASPG